MVFAGKTGLIRNPHEFLMAITLFDNPSGLPIEEITTYIMKELNVKNIPQDLIDKCMEKMLNDKKVLNIKRRKIMHYILSEPEMQRVKIIMSDYNYTQVEVDNRINFITLTQMPNLTEEEINLILLKFKEVIKLIFSQLSLEACSEIIKGNNLKIPESNKSLISILNNAVYNMDINVNKNEIIQLYKVIINDDNEAIKNYLFSMAQSYFIIHILRLDPILEFYTKDMISKRTIYLDTNIIMSSLIGKTKKRSSAINALKLTNKLGLKIRYTNETKNEYIRVLDNKKADFSKADDVPLKRYDKVSDYIEEGMLKDYMNLKMENPSLTSEAYFTKLAGFEPIIQSRYGAEFDSNNYYDVYETDNFNSFIDIVKQEGFSNYLFKSDNVAKHDAFHLLLIKKLRERDESDVFGPKYWFLTLDNTLYNAEKRFYYPEMSSSILAEKWLQIITPLLSPENIQDAKNAYLSLLSSRLPISTLVIDEDDFLLFQDKWIDDKELSPLNVARILGNEWLKSYTTELREKDKEINKEELSKVLEPIIENTKEHEKAIKKLELRVEKISKEKDELVDEKGELFNEKEELRRRQEELMIEKTKTETRYEVAQETLAAFVFLLIFYLIFNFLINRLESWQSFIGALIISLFFGYLLGLKGFKWLINKINLSNILKR